MHDKKETLDARLLKILKNAYPTIHNIYKKLEENNNDITILSSTELDELWYTIKHFLKELQKVPKPQAKTNGNTIRSKEHSICSGTYSSIVKVALQTLKFDDVPSVLLDVLILLNLALPEINDHKVKDEMSTLLEECWKLDIDWREKAVTNALIHLTQCAQTSLKHVKRLNDVKHAIPLLKSREDMGNVMKLVRKNTLLAIAEGRELLVYLFSLGENWIMGIYNNIRVSLQTADISCVKAYSDILIKTWQKTSAENRKSVEECFENLIFHCLRTPRDINGRGKLGANLLTFLQFMHSQTNNAVKRMICDQYLKLLWRNLEAPGCCVRCNAADVLFLAYPMSVSNLILKSNNSLKNKFYLKKQQSAITNLLKDLNEKVCLIAVKGTFHVLKNFWASLPPELIEEWFNIALEHTKNSNCPEIRKGVFQGLKSLLINPKSNEKLKEILPKCADSIYDTNVDVKAEVLELFLEIHNRTKVQIWEFVPLNCIIECLDVTSHEKIVVLFHKLLWIRFFCTKRVENTIHEIIDTGQVNINVLRNFFLHSKGTIVSENAFKLINAILSKITQEIELLPEKEINEDARVKRHKSNEIKETVSHERSNHLLTTNGVNVLSTIQILIDVSALLYAVNSEEFLQDKFKSKMKNLNSKIAQRMRHILEKFEDKQIRETAVFFLSLIPKKVVENYEELSEEYKRKLLDLNVSDDMILSILHLLLKWNKLESVLQLVLSLLKIDKNLQLKLFQAPIAEFGTRDKSETERIRMLKLGLRILEFLLQNEFHSFLVENYHESMIEFWNKLSFIKTLVEDRHANNNENSYVLPEEILKVLFKQYVSMIPLLHHPDKFRASRHFSKIVAWAQEKVLLRAPVVSDLESDQFSISILKCVFETSNAMIVQFKAPPKLCCAIIILYCKSLIAKCGIVFVNDALVTVLSLIQFSSDICTNEESKLLKCVPSLFAALMVSLTKYPVDLVKEYTNNLKSLEDFIMNSFSILNYPISREVIRLIYMAIVFNTAVFCLSKDFEMLLSKEQFTSTDLFNQEFPFISEAIVNIVLRDEGFQDLCIEVLSLAISKYSTQIELLSSLLIVRRLIKSKNKTAVKKRLKTIKTIVSSAKEQIQESNGKNSSTIRDRFVIDAKNKVIQEILKS